MPTRTPEAALDSGLAHCVWSLPPPTSTRKRWHRTSVIFAAFKKFKSPAIMEQAAKLPASTEVLAAAVKGTSGLAPLVDMAQRDKAARPFLERTFSARHVDIRSERPSLRGHARLARKARWRVGGSQSQSATLGYIVAYYTSKPPLLC